MSTYITALDHFHEQCETNQKVSYQGLIRYGDTVLGADSPKIVFCRALGATSGPPFVCKGIFLRYQILLQMKMVVSDRLYKYVLVYFDECSFVLIDSLPVVKRMSPNPALLFLSSSTNWNDMRTS